MGDSLSCRRNTNDDDDAPPAPPPLVPVGGQQQAAPPQPEYMSSQHVRTTRGQPSSSSRNRGLPDYQTRRGVNNVGVRISSQPPALRPHNFIRFCATCNRRLGPHMDVYIFRGESAFCGPECRQVQMDAYARIQDIINS